MRNASKKEEVRILDEVASMTGWSRDNARRRLVAPRLGRPGRAAGREARIKAN